MHGNVCYGLSIGQSVLLNALVNVKYVSVR